MTLFAGLSTGIGSLIAFVAKRTNTNFLSLSLGLSAGVMIYVSFMEMLPKSLDSLMGAYGEKPATLYMILGFFGGGIALIALIDFLVPESRNPHEMHGVEEMKSNHRLKQTGIITAITIAIHNFPEGIATFMSALTSMEVAIPPITAAIAIHNIPEGIAVAVPIYHSTGSKKKSILAFVCFGIGRADGCVYSLSVSSAFLEPGTGCDNTFNGCRHNGLYFIG